MYGEGIQQVAVVQPTGSGKSLLMAKLIEDNPNSRFFVLSTRHEINEQFKEKLDDEMLKRVDFNIYYNMPNMKQEVMESLQPDYIFLDEMHRALAKEWSKGIMRLLEMYPDAKVLGLSATPIRYLDRCRNVAEELFGGNLACDMSLSEAILDGILPMARYVCGVYSFQRDEESLNKKIEKSRNSDEEKKDLLRQVKVLKENLDKGHGVSDIFRKYIVSGSEKFVVFLKDTTHLRVMKPVIEKWFTDAGFSVRLYEVHSKNADKDKEFQAFKEDTENGIIKLCLSVNMISEGIHGDIDGVIMLRETMSPNMYFQMIGRAFSCGKKTIPLIFDLVANSQFISAAADNFPNELRGEIEKRKKECEKEGKEYEVGFDVDEFIVMDEFMDAISGFRAIEGRLVQHNTSFTDYEDEIIKKLFPSEGSKGCLEYIKDKDRRQINYRARILGVKYYKDLTRKWNDEKIQYLVNNYENTSISLDEMSQELSMSKLQIRAKANQLKLIRRILNEEEKHFIESEYPIHGAEYVSKKIGRSVGTIYQYASNQGIKGRKVNAIFTSEDDKMIFKYYPEMGSDCVIYLKNKTRQQINARAHKLGIKYLSIEKQKSYFFSRCNDIENAKKEGVKITTTLIYNNIPLGSFVKQVRVKAKNNKLSLEQLDMVKRIGIINS